MNNNATQIHEKGIKNDHDSNLKTNEMSFCTLHQFFFSAAVATLEPITRISVALLNAMVS